MRKIPIHLFYERKSTNLCTPHGSPSPHRGTPKDLLSFKREIGEKLRVALPQAGVTSQTVSRAQRTATDPNLWHCFSEPFDGCPP